MKRTAIILGAAGIVWAVSGLPAPAQTVIRAPFVRVETGGPYGGTYVRAPFVRIFAPGGPPPVYYGSPPIMVPPYGPAMGPGVQITPPFVSPAPSLSSPPTVPAPPSPLPSTKEPPLDDRPKPAPENLPPAPENLPPANVLSPASSTGANVLSFDQFVKSFQPKAGSYEVAVLNPLTNQATTVRFALPPGTPERVLAGQSFLEYRYAGRQFVRIEFDRDGATVISR